jgi:hypothetical protein
MSPPGAPAAPPSTPAPALPAASDPAAAASAAAGQSTGVAPPSAPPTPNILSSNITMSNGKAFVPWFNDSVTGMVGNKAYTFPGAAPKHGYAKGDLMFAAQIFPPGFVDMWDRVVALFGGSPRTDCTLNEFIVVLMIPYNETGGCLRPMRESFYQKFKQPWWPLKFDANGPVGVPLDEPNFGQDSYLFKLYNGRYNRQAGTQLSKPGINRPQPVLTAQADIDLWNGSSYPSNASVDVKMAARECDFFKFSGLGLYQLTWHGTYIDCANPYLRAMYLAAYGATGDDSFITPDKRGKGVDDISREDLETAFKDPNLYIPSVYNFNTLEKGGVYSAACTSFDAPSLAAYGYGVSGSPDYGANIYAPRCLALKAQMVKLGYSVGIATTVIIGNPASPQGTGPADDSTTSAPPSSDSGTGNVDGGAAPAGSPPADAGDGTSLDGGAPPGGAPPSAPGPPPASADTINQALTQVKAAFPPDSSILSDVQLTANDDTTASITLVINDQSDQYGATGIWPIVESTNDQFSALSISQTPVFSYCLTSDSSTTYAFSDITSWNVFCGGVASDGS